MNKKKNVMLLIVILSAVILTVGSISFANAAAPYERPEDHVLVFDGQTGIALVEEWIHFTVDSQWHRDVRVDVTYLLQNINREHSEIELMFVAPYLDEDEIEIIFDGQAIYDFNMKTAQNLPENWEASVDMAIVDPISLKELPHLMGKSFQFKVNIPEGQTKELTMSYQSRAGYYSYDDVINDIQIQLYYMTPAEFWEGNARVNIMIDFPTEEYALYANIPFEKKSPTRYETALNELPKEEFYFNYVSKEGLVFGTNDRKTHNFYVWALILVIGLLALKWNKWIGRLAMIGLIPVLFLFRPTYGTIFLLAYFGPVILGVLIIILLIRFWLKKKKTTIG